MVKQSLPTLCTAIANAKPDESWIAGSAIDLVSSLIRGCPETGLGEDFFTLLAPSLFNCLEHADDRDVLQVRSFALCESLTFIVFSRTALSVSLRLFAKTAPRSSLGPAAILSLDWITYSN